ncbi:hypothetical protein D9M72_392100 [compost metagenome]
MHVLAADDGQHQQHEADHRDLADAAGADVARVDAHEQRDRNRHRHREGAPRRIGQRLHHDQRQHRQDDDHDHEAAEQRDHARDRAHLGLDQVAQRAAVAARGDKQHHEVLHRAGKHHAGQDPQHARHIAHLRGQHRADQRAGAGDGGEVVAEQHRLVGRHVVQAVVMAPGRRHAFGIELHHLVGDKAAVVAVGDQVDAERGNHDPQRADGFAARQRDGAEGKRAEYGDGQPHQVFSDAIHSEGLLRPDFLDSLRRRRTGNKQLAGSAAGGAPTAGSGGNPAVRVSPGIAAARPVVSSFPDLVLQAGDAPSGCVRCTNCVDTRALLGRWRVRRVVLTPAKPRTSA